MCVCVAVTHHTWRTSEIELDGHNAYTGNARWLGKKNVVVAGIPVELAIKIPVLTSMDFRSDSPGEVSKYSYYYAKEEIGISYLNPSRRTECTMAYCAKLVAMTSQSPNWDYHMISESVRRSGGENFTLSTFPSGSQYKATFNVHPIITICLWPDGGCGVSGFFEARTIALLEPASQQSQCSPDMAVDAKIKMNIFGWVKMKFKMLSPLENRWYDISSTYTSPIMSTELIKLSTIWSGCVKRVPPSLTNDGSVCGRKSSQVGLESSEALISDSSRDPSNPGSVEVSAGSCTGSVMRQVPSHHASSPVEVQLNRRDLSRDLSPGKFGAHKCYDSRTVSKVPWVDLDGNGCLEYAQDPKWCNKYLVNTYARDGNSAGDMCCVCGGGTRVCIQEDWKFPCLTGPPPGIKLPDSSRQAVNSGGSSGPIIGGVVGGLVALISFILFLLYRAKNDVALPPEGLSHPPNLVNPSGHDTGGIQVVSSEIMFASQRQELSHPPNLQNPSGGIQVVSGDAMPVSMADPSGCGVWEPQKDLQTGKIYWTNHVLQKTTWDSPTGGTAGGVPGTAPGGPPHVSSSIPAQGVPPPMTGPVGYGAPGGAMPASMADPSGCGVWEPQKDLKTGKIYWANHALQKTTWDPPNRGMTVMGNS